MKVNTVEDQNSRQISNLVAKKVEDLGNNTYYLLILDILFGHLSTFLRFCGFCSWFRGSLIECFD